MLVLKAWSRKVATGFRKRSCSNKEVERDDDSTRSHRALIQELPVLLDVRGKAERMLADEALGAFDVAGLERRDDLHVVLDRAPGAVLLAHRHGADGAHVDEQVLGHLLDQPAAAEPDDGLVKLDVRLRVLVRMLFGLLGLELVEDVPQAGDVFGPGPLGGEPCRHALERRPDEDQVDDLPLRLAHDEDAAPRHRTNEALLLEKGQRLRIGVRLTPRSCDSWRSSRRISYGCP